MPTIKPISLEHFANKRWIRFTNFNFAANDMICEISAHEVLKAALGMPVCFIKHEGKFVLVALQGLESNKNLYIAGDGRWRGRYIPHRYLCHPFLTLENTDGNQVLCIDEESEFLTDASNSSAEIFFDTEGKPSKQMTELVNFLSGHAYRLKTTREICDLLVQHKLIKPWDLRVQTAKTGIQLQEIYCIDEERLNSLSATSLKELRNKDALMLAYNQLFSMLNVSLLANQIQPDSKTLTLDSLSDDIVFGSNDSGTISFDNI